MPSSRSKVALDTFVDFLALFSVKDDVEENLDP
jgi:hypothetical protein